MESCLSSGLPNTRTFMGLVFRLQRNSALRLCLLV
jgi:hypothetical protein